MMKDGEFKQEYKCEHSYELNESNRVDFQLYQSKLVNHFELQEPFKTYKKI